jgi:hypothetical protein
MTVFPHLKKKLSVDFLKTDNEVRKIVIVFDFEIWVQNCAYSRFGESMKAR